MSIYLMSLIQQSILLNVPKSIQWHPKRPTGGR